MENKMNFVYGTGNEKFISSGEVRTNVIMQSEGFSNIDDVLKMLNKGNVKPKYTTRKKLFSTSKTETNEQENNFC